MTTRSTKCWIALLIASLPWAMTSINGCQSEEDATESQSIELTLLANPGSDLAMAAQTTAIERFEQNNPDVKVRVISATGREYYTKAMTMMAGQAELDVLWLGQGFGMFAARGALMDLEPYIQMDEDFTLEDYDARVLAWYRHEGHLYGFPDGIDARAIAYNKDLFDLYGIPYPQPKWTLEDYIDIARQLTIDVNHNGRTNIYGTGGYPHWSAFGASFLTPDQSRFGMNTPEGLQYLRYVQDMIWKDKVTPSNIEAQAQASDRFVAFYQQKLAMITMNTFNLPTAQKEVKFNWSLAPMPRGVACGAWGSSSGFAITHYSSHPKEAWALIKALTDPGTQSKMMVFTLPSYQPLQNAYSQSEPLGVNKKVFAEEIDCVTPIPRIKRQQEVIAEWNFWFQQVERNEISPKEALNQAEKRINSILDH